jgi:hypothetical protein
MRNPRLSMDWKPLISVRFTLAPGTVNIPYWGRELLFLLFLLIVLLRCVIYLLLRVRFRIHRRKVRTTRVCTPSRVRVRLKRITLRLRQWHPFFP